MENHIGPWPAATGAESRDGWLIDQELLLRVKRNISEQDESRNSPDLEQVETVMLALVRMGLVPN